MTSRQSHRTHVAVLVRLDPQLGRVGGDVTAHDHTAVVLRLIDADLLDIDNKKEERQPNEDSRNSSVHKSIPQIQGFLWIRNWNQKHLQHDVFIHTTQNGNASVNA